MSAAAQSRPDEPRGSTGTPQAAPRSPWHALYTRARHEKRVRDRLALRDFEVFLPIVPVERQWHDRRKTVDTVLFPGYVFARFEGSDASQVLATPGVATVVRQDGRPAPIPDAEIENVRRFATVLAHTGKIPEPGPMVERGQSVRIASGPFRGVDGTVVEARGRGRVLVQVGLGAIGRGIKVEVGASELQPVEGIGT